MKSLKACKEDIEGLFKELYEMIEDIPNVVHHSRLIPTNRVMDDLVTAIKMLERIEELLVSDLNKAHYSFACACKEREDNDCKLTCKPCHALGCYYLSPEGKV